MTTELATTHDLRASGRDVLRTSKVPLVVALFTIALIGIVVVGTTTADFAADVHRVAGEDRYTTASHLAIEAYPDGAADVLLAAGQAFPDALAAASLGGHIDGPLLLADDSRDEVPRPSLAALAHLEPVRVHLIGGTAVLGEDVVAALRTATNAEVIRYAGTDRFDTARLLAETYRPDQVGDLGEARTAIVVNGNEFADALAAGPLAVAGRHPMLLTAPDALSGAAATALAELDIERVLLLGGEGAVTPTVEADLLDLDSVDRVDRLGGADRYETAAIVADLLEDVPVFASGEHLLVTAGSTYPDALAAAPFAAVLGAPILPIPDQGDDLGEPAERLLTERSETLVEVTMVGGAGVLSGDLEREMLSILRAGR